MNSVEIIKNLDNTSDEYLIVGVSTGPDSMALLHMAMVNSHKKIVCCHINHSLRKESDIEEAFLRDYCKNNKLIFEYIKINEYNENNLEAEARKKRYAFYEQILNKYHSHTLLLAHHGDDLIETILMKIIRGTNLEGYAGIKTYSVLDKYTIVRPLLTLTKEDLIIYNKDNNIKYFLDKSNEDIKYTRNRIRKNILPLLKKEDKNIHLKFLKCSNILQEYYNCIEEIAKKETDNCFYNNKLDIKILNTKPKLIKKQIIFNVLSDMYDNKDDIITDAHIDAIIKLSGNDKPNLTINLPNNRIAKKEYDFIKFDTLSTKQDNYKIELKNFNKIGNFVIEKKDKIDSDGNDVCRLNSKNIELPLYLRNKKNGDIVSVLGLNGKKKLKDIFIDEKIPLEKRNAYPLLVDANDNIIWVPNLKKTKYNVKKDEFYDIILNSYEESEENNEKQKENQ